MRKSFCVLTLVLFAVLPFISCSALSSDNSQSGLSVRLPSKNSSRAAKADNIPQWANDIVTFEVSVESVPEDVFTQSKNAGWDETVSFEELPVGSYKVTVLALDSEEKILGRGEETAQVEEGKVSSVKISIKKYIAPAHEEPSGGNESGGLDVEIEFGGTVSFDGEEYDSLAQALLAAKKASGLEIKTITLNGNVKENFVTSIETTDDKTVYNLPYYIQGDVIIDLNGKTLCWEEFTEDMKDDNNQAENPLFQVPRNYTLLIKNGTITSESGVEHSNILIGTTGGTIVLEDVEIKNVAAPYILSIDNYESTTNSNLNSSGALYCENVTIKDCRGLVQSGTYGTSLGIPVSIVSSEFYAQKMTIKDCVGESGLCGIVIQGDSSASFVGGGISLSKDTEISKMDGSALAILGGSLYVSSSTIFANAKNYGAPVKVVNSGSLNLADGFEYKSFSEDSFEAESVLSNGSPYITADTLGLEKTENKIISAENENSTNPENIALILGKAASANDTEAKIVGRLYISGNSLVYGVVDLFMKSSIGVTGAITSDSVIKVKFEDIDSYESLIQEEAGDYPLFWSAGAENASDNREYAEAIPDYFEIYGMSGYTIADSGRKIKYAQGENNGNTIYAPVK